MISDSFSDDQVALMVLVDEGLSKEQAQKVVGLGGVGHMGSAIARKRAELDEEAERAAESAHAASPAGRAEAARAALAAQAEVAELVAGARLLFGQRGVDVSHLTEAELLHYAGIEADPALQGADERDGRFADARKAHAVEAVGEAERMALVYMQADAAERLRLCEAWNVKSAEVEAQLTKMRQPFQSSEGFFAEGVADSGGGDS